MSTTAFSGAFAMCIYCHLLLLSIATVARLVLFFPQSPFIADQGAFIFTLCFTIFTLAQANSFPVYFQIVSAEGSEGCSLHTGHALHFSVMVLLLPTPNCYTPQLTCLYCSAPNSLGKLLLHKKILI